MYLYSAYSLYRESTLLLIPFEISCFCNCSLVLMGVVLSVELDVVGEIVYDAVAIVVRVVAIVYVVIDDEDVV